MAYEHPYISILGWINRASSSLAFSIPLYPVNVSCVSYLCVLWQLDDLTQPAQHIHHPPVTHVPVSKRHWISIRGIVNDTWRN